MTDRKHFKQLVRERMRRTGEHYTVARRHVEAATGPLPGRPDVAGRRGNCAAAWTARPRPSPTCSPTSASRHGGAPLSEAMVLGVGGGLGAGYILWEFESHGYRSARRSASGGRGSTRTAGPPSRRSGSGLHAEIHETGGAKRAAAALDAQLDRGLPAIVWVDAVPARPAWPARARATGYGGPPVVVYGRSGDRFADRRPLARARDGLRGRARGGARPRRLLQAPADRDRSRARRLSDERLRDAVREGLRLQVEHLCATSTSFSLPAWRKWARMTDRHAQREGLAERLRRRPRHRERDGLDLHRRVGRRAPARAVRATSSTRPPTCCSRPALRDAAAAWREAATAWDAIVDTALPPGDELRALIDAGDHEAAGPLQAERDEAVASCRRWRSRSRRCTRPRSRLTTP